LEQQVVERYLDNQFYENVNNPAWRDHLRASLGFCREHAWLGVNRRLGDALGYSIIYHDLVNSILRQIEDGGGSSPSAGRASWRGQLPEAIRTLSDRLRRALTPRKRCPVCEYRDEMARNILSSLVQDLNTRETIDALKTSDGLCLHHLKQVIESSNDVSIYEELLAIHREKLEGLKAELAEFIRKNDYQAIKEGFGAEGDAWLRAIGMVAGSRKE
jgi:DNA-binding transcriptional MerR regulator